MIISVGDIMLDIMDEPGSLNEDTDTVGRTNGLGGSAANFAVSVKACRPPPSAGGRDFVGDAAITGLISEALPLVARDRPIRRRRCSRRRGGLGWGDDATEAALLGRTYDGALVRVVDLYRAIR